MLFCSLFPHFLLFVLVKATVCGTPVFHKFEHLMSDKCKGTTPALYRSSIGVFLHYQANWAVASSFKPNVGHWWPTDSGIALNKITIVILFINGFSAISFIKKTDKDTEAHKQ